MKTHLVLTEPYKPNKQDVLKSLAIASKLITPIDMNAQDEKTVAYHMIVNSIRALEELM